MPAVHDAVNLMYKHDETLVPLHYHITRVRTVNATCRRSLQYTARGSHTAARRYRHARQQPPPLRLTC
jgi:hypothetical protein